jgi:dihydrolipoamide dehydrogenase
VGLTEKAAKEKQLAYKVGKFPFAASGKAVAAGDTEGFVKVISDAKTGEIYGVHILGNEAPELIAEYVLAMNLEATVDEVHRSIHAHPTLSEALMEAAAATSGEAIHIELATTRPGAMPDAWFPVACPIRPVLAGSLPP